METIREHELNISEIKIEDIYEEIYKIALSTEDKAVELQAWELILNYKKDLEYKETREKTMKDMISSLAKM